MNVRHTRFTLVEILISIAIMIIGLVGVMAVFPVGLEANKSAMVDSACANLANSVRNALVTSIQSTPPNQPIILRHDGFILSDPITLAADLTASYIPPANLPATAGVTNWGGYPKDTSQAYRVGTGVEANDISVFNPDTSTSTYNIRSGTGIESQLAFRLDIRQCTVPVPDGGTTPDPSSPLVFDNLNGGSGVLLMVQIKIYRNFQGDGSVPIRAYTTLINTNILPASAP